MGIVPPRRPADTATQGVEMSKQFLAIWVYLFLLTWWAFHHSVEVSAQKFTTSVTSPSTVPSSSIPKGEKRRVILGGVWCDYVRPATYLCDLKKNGPTWETEGK